MIKPALIYILEIIMTKINAMGLPCPMPVVQAKKALEQPEVDSVTIKVDNFIAVQNLEKMAHGLRYEFAHKAISGTEFDAVLSKRVGNDTDILQPQNSGHVGRMDLSNDDFNTGDNISGFVIAIGSDGMGSDGMGSDGMGSGSGDKSSQDKNSQELGKTLMKSFIYSLTELNIKPNTLLFFNSGALLTAGDSGTLGDLRTLENTGTRILTCGACVNYYKLPNPAVGDITNMIEIATIMSEAERLINL